MNFTPQQQEALSHLDGPVMILAGAGSGKTRVLVERIQRLQDLKGRILTLTFSNKAVHEILSRLKTSCEVSTFHAFCVKFLRIEWIKNFSVYDEKDSKKIMDDLLLSQGEKNLFSAYELLNYRESIKQEGFYKDYPIRDSLFHKYFLLFEDILHHNKALDFSSLLTKTLEIFHEKPHLEQKYSSLYTHILVDEYQDTNRAQFLLLKHLRSYNKNLCVVGDEDQSIYSWRGADIRNILHFEEHFPEVKIFKLEQNFRSSKTILEAAYEVIQNNKERKEKNLFSEQEEGPLIEVKECFDEKVEANFIAEKIKNISQEESIAIIYRNNLLSRNLEEALSRKKISYQVYGGLKFYDRKEIKDLLAYFKLMFQPEDDFYLLRILNVPKRSLGKTSIDKLLFLQQSLDRPLFSFLESFSLGSKKVQESFKEVFTLIKELQALVESKIEPNKILDFLLEKTSFLQELKKEKNGQEKIDHVQELRSVLKQVSIEELEDFLYQVQLKDEVRETTFQVQLMTIHATKGLEFDHVFILGLENQIFPSYQSLQKDDLEEERRLFYVALTRAKKKLYLSYSKTRYLYGSFQYQIPSLFLDEIPSKYYLLERVF